MASPIGGSAAGRFVRAASGNVARLSNMGGTPSSSNNKLKGSQLAASAAGNLLQSTHKDVPRFNAPLPRPSQEAQRDTRRLYKHSAVCIVEADAEQDDGQFAMAIELDGEGQAWVVVHVTDLTSFVGQNSDQDAEAKRRGLAAHFPEGVAYMVDNPSRLGIAPAPGQVRPVLTFKMRLDPTTGELSEHRVEFAAVNNVRRMTAEQADSMLQRGPDSPLSFSLHYLCRQAELRYQHRLQCGSEVSGLPTPQPVVPLSSQGRQTYKMPRRLLDSLQRNPAALDKFIQGRERVGMRASYPRVSTLIFQELSILAGEVCGRFCQAEGIPAPFTFTKPSEQCVAPSLNFDLPAFVNPPASCEALPSSVASVLNSLFADDSGSSNSISPTGGFVVGSEMQGMNPVQALFAPAPLLPTASTLNRLTELGGLPLGPAPQNPPKKEEDRTFQGQLQRWKQERQTSLFQDFQTKWVKGADAEELAAANPDVTRHERLGVPVYVPVTSPLQSYPDMMVQYQLRAKLMKVPLPFSSEQVDTILTHHRAIQRTYVDMQDLRSAIYMHTMLCNRLKCHSAETRHTVRFDCLVLRCQKEDRDAPSPADPPTYEVKSLVLENFYQIAVVLPEHHSVGEQIELHGMLLVESLEQKYPQALLKSRRPAVLREK